MRFLLRPGACGLPFRGDSNSASDTNSSSRDLDTFMTPRMTSLKCWNSGVESKAGSFINLPKRTSSCRAPVSSLVSSWALASLSLRFARQLGISQPSSDDLFHDDGEAFGIRHGPIVVAKRLLIQIAEQVERFDTHIGPVDSALEQRPEVLHPIRVDVPVNVLLRVINDLVRVVAIQRIVGEQFIGDNFGTTANVHLNDIAQIVLAARLYMLYAHAACIALQKSEYDFFAHRPASVNLLGPLAKVHVPRLAADKGFVGFHGPAHFLVESALLHREPNTMVHEPRSLLRYSKPAMKFVAADSVLARDNQPRGAKPLLKRNRRVFKDRSSLQGKCWTLVLGVALPHASLCQPRNLLGAARRASDLAVRPAQFHHELAAMLKVREPDNRLVESVWRFHESSMRQTARYVKYIIALL